MTYIKFKVNPNEEAKLIPPLVDWAGMWVATNEAWKQISWKTKDQIKTPINKMHVQYKKKLLSDKVFVEKYWNSVEKDFIKIFEEIMKYKIKKGKTAYFSPLISGAIADVITRKNVWIGKKFTQTQLKFIILHEMIHLYYADYLHEKKLTKQALISPLVEGVDYILLFKTKLKSLLPKTVAYNKQPFNKKNPRFMGELSRAWTRRKNFRPFMKEAIRIEKKYPNVIIC